MAQNKQSLGQLVLEWARENDVKAQKTATPGLYEIMSNWLVTAAHFSTSSTGELVVTPVK